MLLNSLRKTNPDSKFRIHLIHCHLSEENLLRITIFAKKLKLDIKNYLIDPEPLEKIRVSIKTKVINHITASTLIRCYISSILPKSIKRIIYLDTDVVVLRSISPLFEYDLKGNTIGAVPCGKINEKIKSFDIDPAVYFNAGILLIDFAKWRKNKIGETALRVLNEQPGKCIYLDQCALNFALIGQVEILPTEWNVYSTDTKFLINLVEVSIIHYAEEVKPWEWPEHHPFGVFYYIYSKGTPAEIKYNYKKIAPPKKFFRLESIKRMPRRLKQSLFKRIAKIITPAIRDL